jgi:hypothetical protein
MSKYVIVGGFVSPVKKEVEHQAAHQLLKGRPAILLGSRSQEWGIVAPLSTFAMRTGEVLPGGVLLTVDSPAYALRI